MTTGIPSYRAFYIGSNGHFLRSAHLNCASEAEAIMAAGRLTAQGDIELWRGANRIKKLERAVAE